MAFLIPTEPGSPDLYNELCQAYLDFEDGLISEEGLRLTEARYEAAERHNFERAWRAA